MPEYKTNQRNRRVRFTRAALELVPADINKLARSPFKKPDMKKRVVKELRDAQMEKAMDWAIAKPKEGRNDALIKDKKR